MELSEFRLRRFAGDQERSFQDEYFRFTLILIRFSIPLGIILYLAFFLWDYAHAGAPLAITFFIRFAFSVFAAVCYALTFTSFLRRYSQLAMLLFSFLAGAGVAAILFTIPDGYITGLAGICLVILYGCTLFGLQFRQAVIFVVLLVVLANVLIVCGSHSLPTMFVLINANYFFLSFGLSGALFAYGIEFGLRQKFALVGSLTAQAREGEHRGQESGAPSRPAETGIGPQLDDAAASLRGRSGGARIFICYRRSDSADVTGRLYDRLVQEFGVFSVFKDVDALPLGVDFRRHLEKAISECGVFLAVIGNDWLSIDTETGVSRLDNSRDVVRMEIEAALRKNIPVIPVLVKGAAMPPEEKLPPALRALAYCHAAAVRHDPDFHQDVNRLVRSLQPRFQRAPAP